ncbi:2-amino-4-hydroxy-6-hydroxymethyldihydropteridine diphosphokinase [Candidatus Thiothrix sp. Deng01]|uniref:2-amino-4-hydroxy-6-hydroxymethyldihydropteridine pyrophosphokinase n=1 Tax=Candidatus Thiothrix phosphatis TaxID=3112415 RepID=A0ABU6CUI3_9GAMM|nr:2-amino-4-hydroxy-6-hydroxymethyldihydropteridine diphosphokinase [Candidatus Thiothrix sp. Deng01]MEB4590484.1 2-amino-4-hydroxy-6-hydroxymethyldihydropteridine diphosphokinase [Candidatus Thiothrix sp. Deng01]
MAGVYVSLGSNINPAANICACAQQLQQDFPDTVFSRVYQTPAEGFSGAPFLNLAAGFTTSLSPGTLKQYLRNLESKQGRNRNEKKFSSRTLDVDLLLYDGLIIPEQNLPHQDILAYPFVLYPLAEIAPALPYPGLSESLAELAKRSTLPQETLTAVSLDCFRQ